MEVLQMTENLLVDLKLYGMRSTFSERLKQATSSQASYEEFLNLVLHDEKEYRHAAKIKRLLNRAAFKQNASLESIDYGPKRGLTKTTINELATGRFVKEGTNILISGPTGVGKSFLANAIGNNLCRLGISVAFYRMNALIEKIHLERAKGTYINLLKKISAFDLIILDDFGIKPLEPQEYQDLYDIIDERGDQKSLIVTTQVSPENWSEVIPDPVTCEAITDRIVAQTMIIKMKGDSYRKKRRTVVELDKY
jgi:DNA replication protein DnaC